MTEEGRRASCYEELVSLHTGAISVVLLQEAANTARGP